MIDNVMDVRVGALPGGSTITDNTITGRPGPGIVLVAGNTGNTVSANIVQGDAVNGIQLLGNTGNTVSANIVQGTAGNGIELVVNTGNTVSANIVQGNAGNGIRLVGKTGNTVSANIVEGNGLNGILSAAGATGNTFTVNQMSGNGTSPAGGVDARDDAFTTNGNIWSGNLCTTDFPDGAICGIN